MLEFFLFAMEVVEDGGIEFFPPQDLEDLGPISESEVIVEQPNSPEEDASDNNENSKKSSLISISMIE